MNTQQIQNAFKNVQHTIGNLWLWLGIGILLFVAALAIQNVSRRATIASIPNTGAGAPEAAVNSNSSAQTVPEAGVQGVNDYILAHRNSSAQAVPDASVQSVTDYIRLHSDNLSLREYELGERYGVIPQQYTQEQALREYLLGERYGVTP